MVDKPNIDPYKTLSPSDPIEMWFVHYFAVVAAKFSGSLGGIATFEFLVTYSLTLYGERHTWSDVVFLPLRKSWGLKEYLEYRINKIDMFSEPEPIDFKVEEIKLKRFSIVTSWMLRIFHRLIVKPINKSY